MKKRALATLGVATVLAVISIIIPMFIKNQIINAQNTHSQTSFTTSSSYTLYVIKEYEGKVAVYEAQSPTPIKVYDTYISSLPEYDRLLLRTGILVNSKEELSQRIEDFTS